MRESSLAHTPSHTGESALRAEGWRFDLGEDVTGGLAAAGSGSEK